ncbi:TonB-dependent receptor domain-containing protein [Tsuneonella sp. HG249]
MNMIRVGTLKGLACSASALALVVAGPAWAQEGSPEQVDEADGTCATDANGIAIATDPDCATVTTDTAAPGEGAIIVTGSRIKRDTYTSVSPLQVITSQNENEAGLFDPAQILQRTESAAGQQIDATFNGFVLDNGPGSQTLNLRGLGADRTLLLVNGRRLAPAGVEGAPTSPSINLLPGSLIERYELLLDGASSVYGSDAVAGVGNIILRKDFDGLELFARGELNPQGGGDDYTLSASYGMNFDRGFIGIGAEYDYRDAVRLSDRSFFQGCDRNYEVDQNGNIYTVGKLDNATVLAASNGLVRVSESECKQSGISGRIFNGYTRFGSIYFQPGQGNVPLLGNYSDSADAFGRQIDLNGDGIRDVDFQNVNTNGADPNETFLSGQKLYNVMAYGEYTLGGSGNITPFFEANYSRAEISSDNTLGQAQVFPSVPDLNRFNPCNFVTGTGVDCRRADNLLQARAGLPFTPLSTGFPLPTTPIVAIQGDRDNFEVTQEQYRGVLGVRGDLPFISPSWTFEVAGVYSYSKGVSIRRGIREDKLALALGLDPTADYDGDGIVDNDGDGIADDYDENLDVFGFFGDTQYIGECGTALANPNLAAADLRAGCVPVNLFAPSVLGSPIGTFASQAETDYVFGVRRFDTTYEQLTLNGFVTGNLFDLPAGPVGAVIGVEYRKDKIDSQPDFVASNGLLASFFSDLGASGSKDIKEAFAELDIPLQANKPGVRELNLNVSGRVTDEEFYGTNFTYSIKAGWRPVDPLLFKFSYGTSFRAPNLRENFLRGQSGFLTLFDPCAVPTAAFNSTAGGYNPALDTRDANVLANCVREGRDPTRVGIDQNNLNTLTQSSVEIATGGSLDIDPETSRSITAGFAFEETLGGVDVSLGFNYFDIKLKDSIIEPSSQFIINDCFTRDDGQRSPFCDRIVYFNSPVTRFLISDINSGFINLNQEAVRGIDLNSNFEKEVALFGQSVEFGLNLRANHLIERSSLFIDDNGNPTYEDDAGEFGLPKWTGRAQLFADVDRWRATWTVDYTGPVEQDATGIDEFSDIFGRGPDGQLTGFISDTCLGGGSRNAAGVPNGVVAGDGLYCRDVGFAKEHFLHTFSLRYQTDTLTIIGGVDNIFNTAPPLVDGNEVFAINNTAIGNGYDYDGREFFLSVRKKF